MHNALGQSWRRGAGRRGFTLVELMLAASVTALTATAGTALVFAIGSASEDAEDVGKMRIQGNYALMRIGNSIREARCIGKVAHPDVSLWQRDTNGDDVVDLFETALIRYDAATKEIRYQYLEPATPPGAPVPITGTVLSNPTALATMMERPEKRVVVWAEEIETLSFSGPAADTATKILSALFTIGTGDTASAFSTTATPKAQGDYLFDSSMNIVPAKPGERVKRKNTKEYVGASGHMITG